MKIFSLLTNDFKFANIQMKIFSKIEIYFKIQVKQISIQKVTIDRL